MPIAVWRGLDFPQGLCAYHVLGTRGRSTLSPRLESLGLGEGVVGGMVLQEPG